MKHFSATFAIHIIQFFLFYYHIHSRIEMCLCAFRKVLHSHRGFFLFISVIFIFYYSFTLPLVLPVPVDMNGNNFLLSFYPHQKFYRFVFVFFFSLFNYSLSAFCFWLSVLPHCSIEIIQVNKFVFFPFSSFKRCRMACIIDECKVVVVATTAAKRCG